MTSKKPIIAVAQIRYFDESKTHNLKKIKRYIKLAKKKKADIICFPESTIHKSKVLNFGHQLIKEIREECKKNSIWCIINEEIKIKTKTFNVALLINREGKIVGNYKKINLYGDRVSAGKNVCVFDTDFAKIGILICWDIAFPELFQKLKRKGAEIVFCPSQWWYYPGTHNKTPMKREIKILESIVRTRAYENVNFVALCNPVMNSKYPVSYSAIASPTRILKEIVKKEGLIVSKINLDKIKKIEKINEY
ncbi:MAG: carbon-nitrogen hydrolase family protein [Nanoarchaeota archaeon]